MAEVLKVKDSLCKSCGLCIQFCPKDCISLTGNLNQKGYEYIKVDMEKCILCGTCYTMCPEVVFTIEEE